MAVESKTMRISGKDIKDFMNSFDSPEEVLMTLENKAKDLVRDIGALIESMGNLFEQDALVYSMADVCIKVEMSALGQTILKSQIGNPGLLKSVTEHMMKTEAEAKEAEE